MKVIAIDFDGTITENINYPKIGKVKPLAKDTINKIIDCGNEVIIWTCREADVVERYLYAHGIKFTTINENTYSLLEKWGNDPRKIGADRFIDDKDIFSKGINWEEVQEELKRLEFID